MVSKKASNFGDDGPPTNPELLGIECDKLAEPIPLFDKAPCEKIIEGENNSWIVLGRDRPRSFASGYGGRGDTQAGSIDIVVGRMGPEPKSDVIVDPVFCDVDKDGSFYHSDAARIYISQKTQIDTNFKIVPGNVGTSQLPSGEEAPRSAIALKADHVRIVGRETIKIVTKGDAKNSQGASLNSVGGIELIAGNYTDLQFDPMAPGAKSTVYELQPLVKGKNLAEAIEVLAQQVETLNGLVDTILTTQMEYNNAIQNHWHHSPFFGLTTTPSPIVMAVGIKSCVNLLQQGMVQLTLNRTNLINFRTNYLSQAGSKYINSRFNSTN
jgi:hypothetical protein